MLNSGSGRRDNFSAGEKTKEWLEVGSVHESGTVCPELDALLLAYNNLMGSFSFAVDEFVKKSRTLAPDQVQNLRSVAEGLRSEVRSARAAMVRHRRNHRC
jgi:hypothetical protein